MSFNRGGKRNAFGNRNFNRGSGGGSGGGNIGPGGVGMGGAGGGGGGGGSRGGMNPWESGIMPGRGILPTPSNNLSLNSPQAQLVIASNLLSNLLRTQQDTQPQVPSLLSLGNNMNGPGSNFRGQQNYSTGRINDRQMRPNLKNQRPQPYNKMGNNRARDAVTGRRGPSAQQSRAQSQSGNQRINGNQNQHRNDKTSKPNPASKQNQTIKKEPQDVKTSDNEKADAQPIAKSEENDATEDDKNEIKVEKAEGETTTENVNEAEAEAEAEAETKSPVESTEETAADTTNNTTNANSTALSGKKGDDNQPSGKKSEARHAESRYAAVPISHMVCHVCTKYMWDGFSFENHLRGRAHQLMMEKLDESYKLRVDFMRHELKVTEEQRELSLHNSKRRGKKVSVDLSVREYCTMCDLNFYGTLSSHRKSEKHQQLKIFLHPRCIPCAKEFPSRIEYDEHCLTPSHMVNVAQNEEQKKSKKNKLGKGESEVRTGEDEKKDMGPDPDSNEKEEELPENTEYLLDINDDMSNEKYKIPSYKYCRQNQIALGASLVKPVEGYQCDKCRRFVLTAEDMNLHIRTLTHYKNFVAEVKAQTTPEVPEIKTEKSTEKESTKEQEEESQQDDNDGGDVKRRKIEDSTANESTPAIKSQLPNTTIPEDTTDAAKKPDGNEIYDPLEADADSEDENKANAKKKDVESDEIQNEQSMEVWGDGDNDNEPQVGNLLDDDEDEPMETTQTLTTQSQTPTIQSQTLTTQPEPQTQTLTTQPQIPVTQQQTPITQPQTPVTPQQTPVTPQQTPITQPQTPVTPLQTPTAQPQMPIIQPLQQQQLQSTLTADVNQTAKKNNSPLPGSNSSIPQGKSPRGRGFRGRGHQRARRSRR